MFIGIDYSKDNDKAIRTKVKIHSNGNYELINAEEFDYEKDINSTIIEFRKKEEI